MIAVRLSRRRSWHLANSWASLRTLCGRTLPDTFDGRPARPANEPSCENCYRVEERRTAHAKSTANDGQVSRDDGGYGNAVPA